MGEFKFDIIEHYGVFGEAGSGWKKEVNLVSWNGNEPKIDIRNWNEIHTKSSKIATITKEEAERLAEILSLICR